MQRITATLPTLGTINVDFHKESEEVITSMGEAEQRRLRRVPHLGVAASVFTGVNHSRLEYMLLQCAVISLVARIHKQSEMFALSNVVKISGIATAISSGEELLKIWSLLSNFGHTQYTYGVERGLLQFACDNLEFKAWIISSLRKSDLRLWARSVIEQYRDQDFHFLYALLRVSQLPRHDRRKSRFNHYLRNLLLPLDNLFPDDATSRHKMGRLRQLFYRVRLLSLVAIDSHYSHHPVNFNLNAAVLGLVDLMPSNISEGGFDKMLMATAGWLADELYLHPSAAASQRDYELRVRRYLPRRFESCKNKPEHLARLTRDLASNGFGRPSSRNFKHLIRLSFPVVRRRLLTGQNLYGSLKQLDHEIADPPKTCVTIDRNSFTREIHIDFLSKTSLATREDVAKLYIKLQKWLVRSLEAEALDFVRRLVPVSSRSGDRARVKSVRERHMNRRADMYAPLMYAMFNGLLKLLLPSNRRASMTEFMGTLSGRSPILWWMIDSEGQRLDFSVDSISKHITQNPQRYAVERIRELECLRDVMNNSTAPFALICPEKLTICNEHGNHMDEWDGTIMEIFDDRIVITIVEAKSGGTRAQRAQDAFLQLQATRNLIRAGGRVPYRRQRIQGVGATISFTLGTVSEE